VGSAHKWLCAPKGSAFLYVKRSQQSSITPSVISWGWRAGIPGVSQLVQENQWQGTRDLASFLSTPCAIRFQEEHDWERRRSECHERLRSVQEELTAVTGLEPICGAANWYSQMLGLRLPGSDVFQVAKRLYDQYRIESQPVLCGSAPLLRICVQGYNGEEDLKTLTLALKKIAIPALHDI